jgi:hypothetical protein
MLITCYEPETRFEQRRGKSGADGGRCHPVRSATYTPSTTAIYYHL